MFLDDVVDAIETLRRERTDLFNGDEVQLTEHFKIDYSNAYVRKGPKTYRGTCYAAAF